jgi:hypothetical protein
MKVIINILLLLPLILITIGDAIRFFFRLFLFFIKKSYNFIFNAIKMFPRITLPNLRPLPDSPHKEKSAIGVFEKRIRQYAPVEIPKIQKGFLFGNYSAFSTIRSFLIRVKTATTDYIHPKLKSKFITIYPAPISVSWQIRSFFAGVFATIIFVLIPFWSYQWLQSLPNPQLLKRRDLEVATKIFDRNGTLLYEIYADQNRTPLALSEIPIRVQQATIAIEDKDFYHHQGFSIKGMLRAAKEIAVNGRRIDHNPTADKICASLTGNTHNPKN